MNDLTAPLTAGIALLMAAFLYLLVRVNKNEPAEGVRPRRKTAEPQPEHTPETADEWGIKVLRQLAELDLAQQKLERALADLNESTNRRFGRLYQAKSRGTLPPLDTEDTDADPSDPAQQAFPFAPPAAAHRGAAPTNGNHRRLLVPRR